MFPWLHTTGWLLAGARTVLIPAPADVPLLHRDGDPRPAVQAMVEDRPVALLVDPFGASRIGRIAAIRLGLPDGRDTLTFDASIGGLELDDVRAEVVEGDDVVLGLGALPQLLVRIDAASGVLHLHRASDAEALGPFPTPLPRQGTQRTWPTSPLAGAPLDLARPHTVASIPGTWRGGRYQGELLSLDPRYPLPVSPSDAPAVGADAFATLDVSCAPGATACRFEPATTHWTSRPLLVSERRLEALATLQERATTWNVPAPPEAPQSLPSGRPGSSWQMRRWLDLSDRAWSAGDIDAALWSAELASRVAGDHCEAWMKRGELLLRAGPSPAGGEARGATAALPHLAHALEHLQLHERETDGYTLPQSEACRRAGPLLDEARLGAGAALDALTSPLARAVAHLERGAPGQADVALRQALADGAAATPPWLVVHALVQLQLGRPVSARGALARLAEDADADQLWIGTVVLHVLRHLGDEASAVEWLRANASGPAWRAVAERASGDSRPQAPLRLDHEGDDIAGQLAEQVALRLARRPGDPTAWALATWLGVEPPRAPPSIDGAIVSGWLDEPEADVLLSAWPLVAHLLATIPGDPDPAARRTPPPDHAGPPDPSRMPHPPDGVVSPVPSPQEPEMILALATVALAGDFDHTHATLGQFLDGAVSPAGVDYGTLAGRRDTLDAYLKQVAEADASSFDKPQKLALYVNAYNAYTLQTMLDAGAGVSIRDLDGGKVWDTRTFPVAGADLTLNQMEHGNARKLADGRVHAVVNCASKGCPPLPPAPLTPSGMDAQLTAAAQRWVDTNAYTLSGDTVALSKIFDWYGDDFTDVKAEKDLPGVDGKQEQALWFLVRYVDETTKAKLLSGQVKATWADYDWSRNSR